MRVGGATYLAELGVIRGIGHWSLDAWEIYIRIHPTLLQSLLHHRL